MATVTLNVSVSLHGALEGDTPPELTAYAFSGGGELLGARPLKGGTAQVPLPASNQTQAVRVLVGPSPSGDAKPSLAHLVRQGAKEAHLRIDPGKTPAEVSIAIDRSSWHCWIISRCYVSGTLLKHVNRDGVPIDLPVCDATVDIYAVEPIEIILPKIPIDLIDRLRQLVVDPPPVEVPPAAGAPGGPFPPPGPGPDPAPFLALSGFGAPTLRSQLAAGTEDAALATVPTVLEAEQGAFLAARPAVSAESGHVTDPAAASAAINALSQIATVRSAAESGNLEAFRATLNDHAEVARILLCWIFPRFVSLTLVGHAETDDCGHFATWIWKGCDPINLYFTARQLVYLGGFDPVPIEILHPLPVACYTWWNYSCGTDVTLYTTSPFARTCAPCPPVIADPRWVMAMAIGNWPISRIHGLSSSMPADGVNNGLTDGGAPFGGNINLRLEFDDALAAIGVRYYQISWKRAGTSDVPVPLSGDVHRHYAHEVGANVVVDVYTLGPQTVGSTSPLYEIPPAMPPLGKWVYPDAVTDLNNGTFPSVSFAPPPGSGLYELHVNLFDTGGNPVDITTAGVHYVVPTSTDFSSTIFTENAAGDGLVSGNTLILTLHIDNNPCTASIDAPTINGTPAGDDCGVLDYSDSSDSVAMTYHAHQPNGFATFAFTLYRGVNALTPPSQAGPIGGGDFSDTDSAGYLLGTCTIAGYSENLSVWAMAIDGWERLSNYDAHSVRAFVIAPTGS